ncbi:anthranilate phosphoribosyltransferase [Selenomonas sp. oral taxon 138]|uniref:anthranilate phosphoribosyltransferase n=1 Tax=Selenomonas sp. oral taxon 138 TaxID=712532 RepID=UPI0002A41D95|nr:anthranilate phosphoribosyltransferase [Selenomonas sp. oral taxon 138]EKX99770.1 anthranilate phosphoribosyltransferase [Selenomonas sp. oral taxon 138 str. F0429]
MIKEAIKKVVGKEDLTYDEAYAVMNEIMSGETSAVENAAYLAALSTKSSGMETIDEISGSAAAMREHAERVEHDMEVIDIVGTGGDHSGSINVSTTASFLAAAAGLKVCKHGNRAASSWSGTADCLEALGVNIDQSPAKVREELDTVGMAFLFAQRYHQSMKHVGAIRRELGIRTVFNILGPLTNPSRPAYMLLGVYGEHLMRPLARVLPGLGVKRALIVHGTDGMDEISVGAPTLVHEISDGWERSYEIRPEDFGITPASKDAIRGGKPDENAAVTRGILSGEITDARADVCLMNAGVAIYIGGTASSIADGIAAARRTIADGSALRKLEDFIRISQ